MRHQNHRPTEHDRSSEQQTRREEREVAGVGELKAVAEKMMEAGARALESGREWLDPRTRGHRGADAAFHGEREPVRRWPDDDVRSAGESGVYGADAGGPGASARRDHRHGGDEGAFARQRSVRDHEPGSNIHAAQGGHDYDDHRTREFDERAMALQRARDHRLDHIGSYARESGRSPGPRRRDYVPDGQLERADFGRGREFDHLPGSFGYGGEYRRDLSAVPGSFGYGRGQSAYGSGLGDAGAGEGDAGRRLQDYRGRGPKGYSRSDERILDDVNERLSDDPLVDASEIEVRCEGGTIFLTGCVDARWVKHRAEDIADSVSGVRDIDNRIRVATAGDDGQRAAIGDPAAESVDGRSRRQPSAPKGGQADATQRSTTQKGPEPDRPLPQQPH